MATLILFTALYIVLFSGASVFGSCTSTVCCMAAQMPVGMFPEITKISLSLPGLWGLLLFYYLTPPTNIVRGTGQIKLICRILSRRFQINTSLTDGHGVIWINGIAGDASGELSGGSLSVLKMMPVIGYTKRPALCYSDVAKF